VAGSVRRRRVSAHHRFTSTSTSGSATVSAGCSPRLPKPVRRRFVSTRTLRLHRTRQHVHVEGSGAITVVDAAEVQFSSMDNVPEGRPVPFGREMHILTKGAPSICTLDRRTPVHWSQTKR